MIVCGNEKEGSVSFQLFWKSCCSELSFVSRFRGLCQGLVSGGVMRLNSCKCLNSLGFAILGILLREFLGYAICLGCPLNIGFF